MVDAGVAEQGVNNVNGDVGVSGDSGEGALLPVKERDEASVIGEGGGMVEKIGGLDFGGVESAELEEVGAWKERMFNLFGQFLDEQGLKEKADMIPPERLERLAKVIMEEGGVGGEKEPLPMKLLAWLLAVLVVMDRAVSTGIELQQPPGGR